ncbi:mitogen-activated protein kinase kinase kinase 4 isoform X2 [Photinus pyralis]|uniref:mitogen-activated protein kinase kinase kinase 4 isoform X2 n=1 Tax=Photinus pyralis TaxID=7054 RepID=UPI0012674C8C|nr:mitogen-activated protein kinase kinase kinase 4 isoform X2 [Photinus pyralis]
MDSLNQSTDEVVENGTSHNMSTNEDSSVEHNDELSEYDIYGTTPPRTRILRRNRARRQRELKEYAGAQKANVSSKRIIGRRNTISNTFDELMSKADATDSDQGVKRIHKRSMKLLRGSERDLKLDIASAQLNAANHEMKVSHPFIQVESCRRFMSLCSRRVVSNNNNNKCETTICETKQEPANVECPQSRIDFHKALSMLIRMGCGDKALPDRSTRRHISREEQLWQNEFKDLIWLELQAWHADRTPAEQDSYLCNARESIQDLLDDIMTYRFIRNNPHTSTHSNDSGVEDECLGCLSLICLSCMEAQNEGLRDIEKLLNRLEAAESLFPSRRVKAMCLWYNMTKHQLLKIVILGRLLTLDGKFNTNLMNICNDTNYSVDSSSPSDSNSSTSSHSDFNFNASDVLTSVNALLNNETQCKVSPYRKYIENMLKTKGLMKSVTFLERLHQHLLWKAEITLQKPEDDNIFGNTPNDSEEEELIRYGCWSPEAKALQLPSYKSLFLFLASVPLKVIREFLCMRLEQKPDNPSPLSVRQLLRELKEGIRIATQYKERVVGYTEAALSDIQTNDLVNTHLEKYNSSLLLVFELYLDYVKQWALLQHDTFQKSLLEDEWNFCCDIVQFIPDASQAAGKQFCNILNLMLESIGERLLRRIEECDGVFKTVKGTINKKQCLMTVYRELQQLFNEERERCIKTVAFTKHLFKTSHVPPEYLLELKRSIITFKCTIPSAIEKIEAMFDLTKFQGLDEADKLSLTSRCREILQQGFRFGFEFYKVMSELIPLQKREKLTVSMVIFAHLWMKFVRERCERGRGMRPRWAYQGLEFLLIVCEPHHTIYLSESEFEELKNAMDACISHVIGTTAPSTPDSGFHSSSPRLSLDCIRSLPRSRGSSPSPRATYRSQRSNHRKTSTERSPNVEQLDLLTVNNTGCLTPQKEEPLQDTYIKIPTSQGDRVREAIDHLDLNLDEKLRAHDLIGRVIKHTKEPVSKVHLRRRYVTFTWQRGIKIGQGRFGKVYTAVNNNTGEMMAVKEIALQRNDKHTIRQVAEELKILEGISHKNLVKYFGLEIHKDEMLIFMEFCAEGTLENLIAGTENGLPEFLIRRYTYQLLLGVSELHTHGIVHRDLKTANIFLTDDGNSLKIGDFGCATKIKANTTLPGELQGFVGTQAYMAPEVFMKTSAGGHGRAADIWSVGCVVVEMASGKRPWAEYDSNYQIMFKVGMGEKPQPPEYLIEEGHDFLSHCLQHNPRDRYTAAELLDHNFVKIGDDFA